MKVAVTPYRHCTLYAVANNGYGSRSLSLEIKEWNNKKFDTDVG
jgi:hypothetical protein